MNEDYIQNLKPQDLEAERSVLGAILIDSGAELPAIEILSPESFYDERHQKIFKAIYQLSEEHRPIDILSVKDRLLKNKDLNFIGGVAYLSNLATSVSSGMNIDYHAKLVAEAYIKRRLIEISHRIQEKSYDPSSEIESLLDFAEKSIFDIALENISKATRPLSSVITATKNHLEELSKRESSFSGVPSGFTELDRLTSGWQPSDLVIVAARPSMGKTAFILSMARNITIDHNDPVAIFSLEMSAEQLATRLIVAETDIDSEKIKRGKLESQDWLEIEQKTNLLAQAPLYIDDTPGISLTELRAKCRSLKIQYDIKLVIIDYLQLMTVGNEVKSSREQEVSYISRGLKALAKELNIPIIALSQLNRSVEQRPNKRPQLSDLRESGAIEQDADMVIFIHRPEKYKLEGQDKEGNTYEGLTEVIVAKYRNGPTDTIYLQFIGHKAKFQDRPMFESTMTFHSQMNEDFETTGGQDVFDLPNNDFDNL